jgi:hypothetical protein
VVGECSGCRDAPLANLRVQLHANERGNEDDRVASLRVGGSKPALERLDTSSWQHVRRSKRITLQTSMLTNDHMQSLYYSQ